MAETLNATAIMAGGGDARLWLDPATGLNRYFSAPRPSETLAYASSTANDISADAFAHVEAVLARIAPDGRLSPDHYALWLDRMRTRIRMAYCLADDVEIVFAPSGTDLEYVALACVAGRAPGGVLNILLGADEVGTGCIHSARGRYFAAETALGHATTAGETVPGLEAVALADVPVRIGGGEACTSQAMTAEIARAAEDGKEAGRHALVHVVHGSKTGLIVPSPGDIDRLRAKHDDGVSFVVDACQARITSAALAGYLKHGAIVLLTGSKFIGGPPFSGFALVPAAFAARAAPLPAGFATIFRRAEWPAGWPGADRLPAGANLGLLLRLEASLFELERFQRLAPDAVERVVLAFHAAVRAEIVETLGARRVAPYPPGDRAEADDHPIEMRTLSTLDLSALGGGATFEDAQAWHKALIGQGVRLGQPVKCVKLPAGQWGATLRIALSMPMIVERSALSDEELAAAFKRDMKRIARALEAVSA